jgi:histidine ammonia-lyase
VAAAALIATVQGVELRGAAMRLGGDMKITFEQLRGVVPALTTDRALEGELRLCVELIRRQHWRLYE